MVGVVSWFATAALAAQVIRCWSKWCKLAEERNKRSVTGWLNNKLTE